MGRTFRKIRQQQTRQSLANLRMGIETVIIRHGQRARHIQHRARIPAGLDRNRLHANEMVESRTPEAANKYRQKADGSVAVDAKFMHL